MFLTVHNQVLEQSTQPQFLSMVKPEPWNGILQKQNRADSETISGTKTAYKDIYKKNNSDDDV